MSTLSRTTLRRERLSTNSKTFPVWIVPSAGAALILMLIVTYLATPSAIPSAPKKSTVFDPMPLAVAPLPGPSGDWLEENFLLRSDDTGAIAVHPEGEIILASPGGNMEARVQNGEFTVEATRDGGWRLRAAHPEIRGELAVWCGQEMYSVRVRCDAAAPLRRRIWLLPPPPPAGTSGPGSDPTAERDARTMLDTLINLESHGPVGQGTGEYGNGAMDGITTHWRRALRLGNVCGAVVDISCQRADPFFYEPSSLAVDLPGRGVPDMLARSGEGMVLPGKTLPALAVWYDPLPPGTAPDSEAAHTPPKGPYTLRLHPWSLEWRDLAALATPPTASPPPTPRNRRR